MCISKKLYTRLSGLSIIIVVLVGVCLPVTVKAQDSPPNLLTNGSMESPYYSQNSTTQTVPYGWNLWIGDGAPDALPRNDLQYILDGSTAWHIKQDDTIFTAAGYQQITVTPGETLLATAWGWVFTCDDAVTSCATTSPPYRQSDPSAGTQLRIGIDPLGGTNPLAAAVVWSATVAPYDQWVEMNVIATAQNNTITLFLYTTQMQGLALNEVYWDRASLTVADATEPILDDAPFVVPQGVQPDGSIIHVIQAGDTLWGIVNTYRDYSVTRESIAALNEGIRPNTSILQLGQSLVILPPGSVDPVTGQFVTQDTAPEAIQNPSATASTTLITSVTSTEEFAPTITPTNTPTSTATATPTTTPTPEPTATMTPQSLADTAPDLVTTNGTLCVTVYSDTNLSGTRDTDETPLGHSQIVIAGGSTEDDIIYDGAEDPLCIKQPAGEYTIRATLPTGYGLTTADIMLVTLAAGRQVTVLFGGAEGYTMPDPEAVAGDVNVDAIEPGVVAPVIKDPITAKNEERSLLDRLYQNSGLLVLLFAGVVAIGSVLVLMLYYRPQRY